MISWFRTYQSRIGKMAELVALSQEAAKYLESAHGLKVEVYTQVGGDPLKIGLLGRYNNLGDVGELEEKIGNDSKWATLMSRGEELAVEGSLQDQFWKQIS